jgi:hypothetical protein
MGHDVNVNLNVYRQTPIETKLEAVGVVFWNRLLGKTGRTAADFLWCSQVIKWKERETGNRTRDFELANLVVN